MFEQFFSAPNLPFAVALLVMLGIGLLEGIGMLLGGGLSGLVDGALPDLDADLDVDVDAGLDGAAGGSLLAGALSWLHVGKVPFLILFLFFLMSFGLAGLFLQYIALQGLGSMLPAWVAALAVLPLTLPGVRVFGGLFARVFPKDETTAVPRSSFIGSVAVVVIGTARRGAPAQAKLRDPHGQTHYVMIEPDGDDEAFVSGTSVILISQHGAFFRATRNTMPELVD